MKELSFTFIYDGECPFCNHFAELLELKSNIKNISILDGRKNPVLIKELLSKGYDLNNGAILLKGNDILHGSSAINTICKQIQYPSNRLLEILAITFKSKARTKLIFPFLVNARRFTLRAKGIPINLD